MLNALPVEEWKVERKAALAAKKAEKAAHQQQAVAVKMMGEYIHEQRVTKKYD